MMGAGLAPVPADAAPGIALGCLPQDAATSAICAQMRETIVAAQPGVAVQVFDAEALPETMRAVRLHVEGLRADAISAHLEWRQAGQPWQRGETMAMRVMDRNLNAQMVARFLASLWTESPAGR